MEERNDKIWAAFRTQAEDYTPEPQADSWAKLAATLPAAPQRTFRLGYWQRSVAAVTVLLLAATIALRITPAASDQEIVQATTTEDDRKNYSGELVMQYYEVGNNVQEGNASKHFQLRTQ